MAETVYFKKPMIYQDFHRQLFPQAYKEQLEKDKKKKNPVSGNFVSINTLLMKVVRGEWPEWFKADSLQPYFIMNVQRRVSLRAQYVAP